MSIVLREREWVENAIQSKTLGKKPSETLRRVARYYIDKGYSKKETRKYLDAFLIQCEPMSSLSKWSDALDYALARALKYEAIEIDSIDITRSELEKIDALEGKQVKRLAFTLLCLAKYWNAIIPNGDNWVNNKDSEIMALANINTSIKRQGAMYHTLHKCGMVHFSKKVDNTNVRVCFIEDGDVLLRVKDFKNLGYQYMMFTGSNDYIVCQNCGIVVRKNTVKPVGYKQNSGNQKYCRSCAAEIALQRSVNSVMRFRDNDNVNSKPKKYTVYMHVFPNGKKYIGMTSRSLHERWKNGKGYCGSAVGNAICKYGWENVKHYLLFEGLDRHSAKFVEKYVIEKDKTYNKKFGYNTEHNSKPDTSDNAIPEYMRIEVNGNGVRI